ncbi:MAG: hydrogenase iron-sulfur subunit [Candidatus Nealsonbacteria bacterium]|nr:hydrogenase iron-sulfur subunit [Candidatus Nealsonbacteria bacterium]
MAELVCPGVAVFVCVNSIPAGKHLPRQWMQDGVHVQVREIPCSGKIDVQYLMHVMEGGARGLCVVTCPTGECQMAQGNYRAEVRVATIRKLLEEIGMEPERAELVHNSPEEPLDRLEKLIRDAVERIRAVGDTPMRTATNPVEKPVEKPAVKAD